MSTLPKWNVAVIGECMIELHKGDDTIVQSFGGDTLNTAAYLSRICAQDARVEYVSAVGDTDWFSRAMLDFWHGCGVRSALTQRLCGKLPGLYAIEVDAAGERHFHYWRREAAVRGCFETAGADDVLAGLATFDLIYLSGISLAVLYPASREKLLARLEELSRQGVKIGFDFNFRPRLWGDTPEISAWPWYERLARICHTVFLSLEEARIAGCDTSSGYNPALIERLWELGAVETVVKDGASPCLVLNRDTGEATEIPLHSVLVPLDTTAAGDSFAAGYLAARHRGLSEVESVRCAHMLASTVIMHRGAIIPEAVTPDIFAVSNRLKPVKPGFRKASGQERYHE